MTATASRNVAEKLPNRPTAGGENFVRLTVADDGTGFSADALAHATERFWRDDSARARRSDTGGETGGGAVVVVELPSAAAFMSS
jgi:signal transduction histidine kinase